MLSRFQDTVLYIENFSFLIYHHRLCTIELNSAQLLICNMRSLLLLATSSHPAGEVSGCRKYDNSQDGTTYSFLFKDNEHH